jgi:hypothetical protein
VDATGFDTFLKACFAQKRKTLANNARGVACARTDGGALPGTHGRFQELGQFQRTSLLPRIMARRGLRMRGRRWWRGWWSVSRTRRRAALHRRAGLRGSWRLRGRGRAGSRRGVGRARGSWRSLGRRGVSRSGRRGSARSSRGRAGLPAIPRVGVGRRWGGRTRGRCRACGWGRSRGLPSRSRMDDRRPGAGKPQNRHMGCRINRKIPPQRGAHRSADRNVAVACGPDRHRRHARDLARTGLGNA